MSEKWNPCRDITNYDISDEGRVRNSKTGRIMKTSVDKHGYEIVCLHEDGKQYTKKVHRLVAEAFTDEDIRELDVAHRDGNRLNNRLDNLVHRTRQETVLNGYSKGRRQTHKMQPVFCLESGKEYGSVSECSKEVGLSRMTISRCMYGWQSGNRKGLHFVRND